MASLAGRGSSGHEPDQHAVFRVVDQHVEIAVRSGPYIPDSRPQAGEHPLFLDEQARIAADAQPDERAGGERPDEEAPAPFRIKRAAIDGEARRCDRGRPIESGRFDAGRERPFGDHLAVIVDSVADPRPAVIQPGLQLVDLVAAARAMVVRPDQAGGGVESQPLDVAMAQAPDLGRMAGAADERIVGGCGAVAGQAENLAEMRCGILRRVAIGEAVADASSRVPSARKSNRPPG